MDYLLGTAALAVTKQAPGSSRQAPIESSAVSTSSCHTQLQSVYSTQDGVDPESGAWMFEIFVVLKMGANRTHYSIISIGLGCFTTFRNL